MATATSERTPDEFPAADRSIVFRFVAVGIVLLLLASMFVLTLTSRVLSGRAMAVAIVTSSWKPGDPGNAARAAGTLEATSTGCLYLTGDRGEVVVSGIVWPSGFSATQSGELIEVRDAKGVIVARTGQRLVLGGGFGGGSAARCAGEFRGSTGDFYVSAPVAPLPRT